MRGEYDIASGNTLRRGSSQTDADHDGTFLLEPGLPAELIRPVGTTIAMETVTIVHEGFELLI